MWCYVWVRIVHTSLSLGYRQSHSAGSDPQPVGIVPEAAGSHPRGWQASPVCPDDLQWKWQPKEPGPGTGQSGLLGSGCGCILGCRTIPGQVRDSVLKVSLTEDRPTWRCSYCSANCITRALQLFLELWESPTDEEHVQTYLWLGRSYKQRGLRPEIRACYELGLLIALHAHNLHSESNWPKSRKCCKMNNVKDSFTHILKPGHIIGYMWASKLCWLNVFLL